MSHHTRPGMSPYPRMPDVRAHEETPEVSAEWFHEVMTRMKRSLSDLSALIEDTSHRVDEYQVTEIALNIQSVQLQADYDVYPEIITAILITGPASTGCTVQLGKRLWNLNTSTSGFFTIAPIRLSLDRDDVRILTSATPGNWSLELMGYADIRYRYK